MTDIRKYIDLIEHGFMGRPNSRPAFGRKNTTYVAQPPERDRAAIEAARQHTSAEAYAQSNNSLHPWYNTDPEHIVRNGEREHNRLKARWNDWKEAGWL